MAKNDKNSVSLAQSIGLQRKHQGLYEADNQSANLRKHCGNDSTVQRRWQRCASGICNTRCSATQPLLSCQAAAVLIATAQQLQPALHSSRYPAASAQQVTAMLCLQAVASMCCFCCCGAMRCYSLGWSSAGSPGSPPACSATAQKHKTQAHTSSTLHLQ
jgi:hypothetical protein